MSMWDTIDVETDQRQARLTTARIQSAVLWPFLAGAVDREDFANRLELAGDRLTATAAMVAPDDPDLRVRLEAAYVQDFERLLAARPAPLPAAPQVPSQPRQAAVQVPKRSPRLVPQVVKEAELEKEACGNCGHGDLQALGDLDLCKHCGLIQESKRDRGCPLCHNGPDTQAHFEEAHEHEEDSGPKYNRPGSGNVYTHWGDTDDEGNAVGTGTGRSKRKKTARGPQVQSPTAEEVEEARKIAKADRTGLGDFTAEYDAGLPCSQAGCEESFFSDRARVAHLQETHGLVPAPPKVQAQPQRRRRVLRRRTAANDENLMETCKVCGKKIPASEMAHHMEKEHPHEAVTPEDEERGEEAESKEAETKENREKHRPKERRERKEAAASPFDTSNSNNPFVSSNDSTSSTPSTMQTSSTSMPMGGFSPGVGTDAQTLPEDLSMPPNMDPKSAQKIATMVADIRHLNPGITPREAHTLAVDTFNRYFKNGEPQVHEARGGADYVDGERLVRCGKCSHEAKSTSTQICHWCGAIGQ